MATKEAAVRPNIRIEIQNNLAEEPMQVDDEGINLNSEEEEGEISDGGEQPEPRISTAQKIIFPNAASGTRQWTNAESYGTGINVLDKEEQQKKQIRAERFGISAEEGQATNDVQLQELYDSLGVTSENEKTVRFEAVHMNGTEEMSTQDVFSYFEIFAPVSVEWVDDASCNVVWNDKISAARALVRLSEPIRGMPVEGPCDPFASKDDGDTQDSEPSKKGRSILLIGKDRDIELKDDEFDKENGAVGRIHVSEITVPVPPGYWRLGKPTEKSKYILLRFASRTDKKPFKAERFSQYYKKYGNPNYGGLKGIISESKKKQMKGIFDRHSNANPEIEEEEEEDSAEPVNKTNPWGSLAKNWNMDHRQEKIREEPFETVRPIPQIPIDSLPTLKSSGMLNRLGYKRAAAASESDSETEKPEAKKSKVPRMRMYADEEEEKIKRKNALKLLGKVQTQIQSEKVDLRSKLKQSEIRTRIAPKEPEYTHKDARLLITKTIRQNRTLESYDHRSYKIKPARVPQESDEYSESDESDSNSQRQKSKVTVIIKKQRKPTVASTVWTRVNNEKQRKKQKSSDDEEDEEDSSSSDSEKSASHRQKLRTAVNRPGFSSGNLKARLGVKSTEHKSPLRIEISNDLFKSKSKK